MRNLKCQARGNVLACITCDVQTWRVNKTSLSEVNLYHTAGLGSGMLKTPPTWRKAVARRFCPSASFLHLFVPFHQSAAPITCLSQTLYNLHNRQRR
jgi:hypothetical protein